MHQTKKIYIDSSIESADKLKEYLDKNIKFNVQIINISLNTWNHEPSEIDQIILLIKLYRHGQDSIEYIHHLRKYLPNLLCLLLIHENDREFLIDALKLGVNGLVFERSALCVINDSVDQVLNGGMPITSHLTKQIYNGWQEKIMLNVLCLQQLTVRENEIMVLLAKGHLYKEIAYHLNISMLTVKNHLKNIYKKIGVTNRSEAIVKFLGK